MAKPIRTHHDFGKVAEIRNAIVHPLNAAPSSPVDGQIYYDTALTRFRVYSGATLGWQSLNPASTRLDQIAAPTASVDFNSQRITGVGTPTAGTDATNKTYVDGLVQGISSQFEVMVRAQSNVNLAAPGATIDGVTMAAGDTFLAPSQTLPAENGIYVWNGAAVPATRATNADSWAEMVSAFVFVQQGTDADKGYVSQADKGGTLGTTAITFSQFSAAGTYTAGAGILQTGSTFDVVAASGSGIVVNADNIDIDPVNGLPINRGGTGAITAAGARTALGVRAAPQEFTITGDGVLLTFTVTHNLNSKAHIVQVRESATDIVVDTDITLGLNADTIGFAAAVANGTAYKVVVA